MRNFFNVFGEKSYPQHHAHNYPKFALRRQQTVLKNLFVIAEFCPFSLSRCCIFSRPCDVDL